MSIIPRTRLSWELEDGSNGEGDARPGDWAALERHLGKPMSALGDELGMDGMLFLAYRLATRNLPKRPAYEHWADTVVDFDVLESGTVPS